VLPWQDPASEKRQFKLNVEEGAFTDSEILVMLGEVSEHDDNGRGERLDCHAGR